MNKFRDYFKPDLKKEEFSIYSFLRDNEKLFTIIGIIGALLALLPNFLQQFLGLEWKLVIISNPFGWIPILLFQLAIISGVFFIILVASTIIKKLPKGFHIDKIQFLIIFVSLVLSTSFFLVIIISFIEDITINLIQAIVIIIFIFTFATILDIYWIWNFKIAKILRIIVIIVLLISLFIILYKFTPLITLPFKLHTTPDSSYFGNISIKPDIFEYSPLFSPDYGIGFDIIGKAENLSEVDYWYIQFHWSTNYGYFLTTDSNGYLISNKGEEYKSTYKKTYWTYDIHDIGIKKPQVIIFLRVEDIRTNKILAKTRLNITWQNMDIAQVRD